MTTSFRPKILVLEGLYSDTADIVDGAGGDAFEVQAHDIASIERELESGQYHGMLLTGGSDVDPKLYGQKPHPQVYGVDYTRDTAETYALWLAQKQGLAVLGICRGSQIMNAYRGGTLTQHIEGHRATDHRVFAVPGCRTYTRAIGGRAMDVVSLHHQCVDKIAPGFQMCAIAHDGTPEAIESLDGLWLGVQYHPEMAARENGQAFEHFKWLVRTAAMVAGKEKKITVRSFREFRKMPTRYTKYTSTTAYDDDYTWDNDGRYDQWRGTSCATPKPEGKHRKAGERVFKGKDATDLIEEELALHLCPMCGMLFDFKTDRDDHVRYVENGEPYPEPSVMEANIIERYPELEPPAGHEAWEDEIELASE